MCPRLPGTCADPAKAPFPEECTADGCGRDDCSGVGRAGIGELAFLFGFFLGGFAIFGIVGDFRLDMLLCVRVGTGYGFGVCFGSLICFSGVGLPVWRAEEEEPGYGANDNDNRRQPDEIAKKPTELFFDFACR